MVFCCSAIAEICTASVIKSSLVLVNDNFSQSQPFTILAKPNMVILSDWSSYTHQISMSLHMLYFSLAVGKKRSGYKEAKNCYFLGVCVWGGGGGGGVIKNTILV